MTLTAVRGVTTAGDTAPHGRREPRLLPFLILAATLTLAGGARLPGATGRAAAGITVTFVSLCLEALPFLLAGAALASLLNGRLGRLALAAASRGSVRGAALAPFAGMILPLCDCGLVPLARQARDAGVRPTVVNAFVAGAPLTNPIVIVSSLLAFPGAPWFVVGRVGIGILVAWLAALLVSAPTSGISSQPGCHDDTCSPRSGLLSRVSHELLSAGPALVVGAFLAAALKQLIPIPVLLRLAEQPLLAAAAMMALAFVMSICSQADAFVAASLPLGPLPRLAFLTIGPVLDLKLAVVYRSVFGGRWVLSLAAVAVPAVLVLCAAWVTWGPG